MANSLLQAFVSGTRALLSAQLIVCVLAVALAGWTLTVTNQFIRERDRLQERVIQLEETMAARGDIPPEQTTVVESVRSSASVVYPGSSANAVTPSSAASDAASTIVAQAPSRAERDIGSIVASLFGPAPPLNTIVLHVQSRADADEALRIAQALQQNGALQILIQAAPQPDRRQPGYVYFDGRQSRRAAETVTRFHEIARELQIAQWSAQLRGMALPAQGEYTADRLDIVLPALPAPPPPAPPAVSAPAPAP
jgi:hypothetical protein